MMVCRSVASDAFEPRGLSTERQDFHRGIATTDEEDAEGGENGGDTFGHDLTLVTLRNG